MQNVTMIHEEPFAIIHSDMSVIGQKLWISFSSFTFTWYYM
jgi:hypothetical protein